MYISQKLRYKYFDEIAGFFDEMPVMDKRNIGIKLKFELLIQE